MSNKYESLMEIEVIASGLGQLFAFSLNGFEGIKASAHLASIDESGLCQFTVYDAAGQEKGRYFIVGNHYDNDTLFSPKEHNWFAEGATPTLKAVDFVEGDVIKVDFKRPDYLAPHQMAQIKMAVWVLLTHQAGSAGYLDNQKVRALLRSRPR